MELSIRLKCIASMVDKCNCIADIGTDHGYIPIYLLKNHICEKAIASDINSGPVEKARFNIKCEGLEGKIQCKKGSGLTTIVPFEAQGVVIAGMGGNLIRDIIVEKESLFKEFDFAVLQPVQNPEVLRKFIYDNGYKIIDEDLCIDENKFYEIIKVKHDNKPKAVDNIYYEVSKTLVDKKHPLMIKYIGYKINLYNKALSNIKEDSYLSNLRKIEILDKINRLKELKADCQ